MRLHRFYVLQPLGEEVVIDEVSLINQWKKVLRYGVGDFVVLYNGDGNERTYTIDTIAKSSYLLKQKEISPSYIPTKKSYLYISLIKKDAFELASKMATEAGVTDIIPLVSERTKRTPLDFRRLSLITKEASEQSGRGDIPTIHDTVELTDLFKNTGLHAIPAENIFIATRNGESIQNYLHSNNQQRIAQPVAFVVGPEGGWTEEEEAYFSTNTCTRISLGSTVLRAETAGIVCSFLSTLV